MSVRVLVMGTGGVGGYFGGALAAAGHDIVFVARGENLRALRTSGLRVIGAMGEIVLPEVRATDVPAEAGERDLVLMCVKLYDLEEAAEAARPCGGVALTLQNGVEAADRVSRVLGPRVLAGTTGIVADLVRPGEVRVVSSYARIRLGETAGGRSERAELVGGWLDVRGIEVRVEDDVRVALWEKMALICAMAGLTTLCRSPVGPILSDEHGRASFRRIVEECEAVARGLGVPLPRAFVDERMRYAARVDPDATSSMLRDLRRGRRLEVDDLNGAIVRLARAAGVAAPVNEVVYAGIRLAAG